MSIFRDLIRIDICRIIGVAIVHSPSEVAPYCANARYVQIGWLNGTFNFKIA